MHADTLVRYLPDQSGAVMLDSDPVPPDTVVTGLDLGNLVQSEPQGFGNALVWPVQVAAPRSATRYLSFTIEPLDGRVLAFSRLLYSGRSYQESSPGLHLRTSLDGFAADVDSRIAVGVGARDYTLAFDLGALPTGIDQLIELRLYPDNNGGASDFMDLRGNRNVGMSLLGEFGRMHEFADSDFYSFSLDIVGGFEIPDADRHLRFGAPEADIVRLRNQPTGDARVKCLSGQRDFFSAAVYDPTEISEQSPACLELSVDDLPSEVTVWKLPDGRLFRFQLLDAQVEEDSPGAEFYLASGTFQAGPLSPVLVFRDDFE